MDPNPASPEIQFNIPINPNPEASKPNHKSTIVIGAVSAVLLVVLLFVAFIFWQIKIKNQNINTKPTVNSTVTVKTPPQNTTSEQIKKIAYSIKGTLWIINSDGTDKTVLYSAGAGTSVGIPDEFNIPTLNWKNAKQVSFALCAQKGCSVSSVSIANPRTLIPETNPDPDTQILAIAWNHVGNTLAYIYKLPDGEMKMDFKTANDKQVVKTFAVQNAGSGGRDATLDDNISIYFSPDDKYVLVTNTLGQPNNIDSDTIWVFDNAGKEILNIKSDTTSWATQARWSQDNFIYKLGSSLFQREITTSKPELVATLTNFYNPTGTLDKGYFYWTNTSDLPYLSGGIINEGGVGEEKLIKGYYKPEILDETHLVSLKASLASLGQEVIFPFVTSGLSIIELKTKEATDLDSGDISQFAISP